LIFAAELLLAMKLKMYYLPLVFLASCQSHHSIEQKKWEHMMDIHDEVMPKTGEIVFLAKQLQDYMDSTGVPSLEIEQSISLLNDSEEAMFEWMSQLKQLKTLRKNLNHQEIMDYLHEETQKIEEVKQKMETSLTTGQNLFNNLNSNQ
jgi:hypothetical protein